MANNETIIVKDSKFIFKTNFSGDPNRDNFGNDARKANIILPEDLAHELMAKNVKVKTTKPKPGEEDDFVPTYFVPVNANYDSPRPPKIYLVSGDNDPRLLDEDSVCEIDHCYVLSVYAQLNLWENPRTGTASLYVNTMYVTQEVDDDPFAYMFRRKNTEEVPF